MRFLPALVLAFLAAGCMSDVTTRADAMIYQLDMTNRQLAVLNEKMAGTTEQVQVLGQKLDTANQRFEDLEKVLKRSPFLGPPQPVKPPTPPPEE